MSKEMLGDAVIWMLLFAGYMALLFVSGIIAEYILPRIPAAQRLLDSLPPYEDDYENKEEGYMRISTEEKKAEAVRRMKALGIFPQTIKQFEKEGYVSISEPPVGAFYWAEGDDLDRIRQFEEKHDALVYVVIRSYFDEIGKTDAYLFVSDYVGEWETDQQSILRPEDGVFAYVYSHDAPWCSEMGDIGVTKTIAAGLQRTW